MPLSIKETRAMITITTKDGTEIYWQGWGESPVVTFSHGWPLNADTGAGQLLFLAQHRYRVIAHDRRSLRRGIEEDKEAAKTGLSCQPPGEDPGTDPDRPDARPGRAQ
jgi:pimeloyl-ACP methyl ester carboxylesterase